MQNLPVRTQAPVKHRDRFEFLSDGWIDCAREYLSERLAKYKDSIKGQKWSMCELYKNAPPHLKFPDNVGSFHIIIKDGKLTVGRGGLDKCNFKVLGDYNKGWWVATGVYDEIPERQTRIQRETRKLFGDIFEVENGEPASREMGEIPKGMHNHLAKRTLGNPDIPHKIKEFGLQNQVHELEEKGYTIFEGAFSSKMAAALTADLTNQIAETRKTEPKRYAASMLLARGHIWEEIAVHPKIHAVAQHMLGADCLMGQSLGFTKKTGTDTHPMHNDPPHPDTGNVCANITTIWALEDFTETSGPTVVVPGSHKLNCAPAPDAMKRAKKIIMPRGSVAMWHGSLWHGAAIRQDEGLRLTIHNTYLRNWVRTWDDYLGIDPVILERNPPAFSTLCGVDDMYGKNTYSGPDNSRRE